jgi:hypothetical protein
MAGVWHPRRASADHSIFQRSRPEWHKVISLVPIVVMVLCKLRRGAENPHPRQLQQESLIDLRLMDY